MDMKKSQSGIMLLEALIAILVFSLGILGIIGLQASAVNVARDAKYRADAALLANELVGQMWSSNRTGTALQTAFQGDSSGNDGLPASVLTDGASYTAWAARVDATLPGVGATNPPLVTVAPGVMGPPQTASVVNIVVRWQAPNEAAPHSYSVVVNII